MAVPSLIHKAALTLFHNPHMQPEDVSVPYGDFSPYVTVIQRSWRRRTFLHRAATRINALLRAFRIRCFVQGLSRPGPPGFPTRPRIRPARAAWW
jgi:hypothetical protein